MTIGIDTSRVTKTQLTGTEYYSIQLIKKLNNIETDDKFLLYAQKDPHSRLGKLNSNFKTKIMPFPRLWSQIRLSIEMIFHKPEVLFVPAHLLPLIHPKNSVVTIHDLGFKKYPELYPPHELLYHNFGMNFSVKHAKKIIAISEATKKDLLSSYAIEPNKIEVIWQGCDLNFFKPSSKPNKKPYIFYIGRIEEKKNIINMVKAFAFLKKEKGLKHQFILAGSPGYNYENIKKEIDSLPSEIRCDIIELGYISQNDYLQYLQEAEIFLFVTNFEGFGMPIIEAMACGTPVITSNVSSMPEIAANAALLVNPCRPNDIGMAMSKLIHNPGLRQSLILKGRVRSKIFTWQKTAQKTLAVLEQAGK